MALREKFSTLVTKLEMSMHINTPTTIVHRQTDTHTQTSTAARIDASTPAHTAPPTPTRTESSTHVHTAAPTVEQLHLLVQQLNHENNL